MERWFDFDSFRDGCPSAKAEFQGAFQGCYVISAAKIVQTMTTDRAEEERKRNKNTLILSPISSPSSIFSLTLLAHSSKFSFSFSIVSNFSATFSRTWVFSFTSCAASLNCFWISWNSLASAVISNPERSSSSKNTESSSRSWSGSHDSTSSISSIAF